MCCRNEKRNQKNFMYKLIMKVIGVALMALVLVLSEEIKAERSMSKQTEIDDSFYQKLEDGTDVNILIVGDSIGEGAGASSYSSFWVSLLQAYLQDTYSISNINVTNVSMGGNASYAGYVRTMSLNDNVQYDLAIICYGQNDDIEDFSTYYESIVRGIRRKYPNSSIISILESSQREYTGKMIDIQHICKHYGIPVADTIAAFNNSGKVYEDLSNDGVHPNDEGQKIYFETVKNVIDDNVEASSGKMKEVSAINRRVYKFDNFVWYGADSDFARVDDVTFVLNTSVLGIMGIDYTYESGNNNADIYVDGKLFKSPTVTFDYDFSQRHILVVSDECSVENEIKVVFASKEQADGFKGICFSWK